MTALTHLIHERNADALISTREAAALLQTSVETVNRLARNKTLRSYKLYEKGKNRFRLSDIERLAGGNI